MNELKFVCLYDSIYNMKSQELAKLKLPDTPGVYFFWGPADTALGVIPGFDSAESRLGRYTRNPGGGLVNIKKPC
jgi:hypothetical protein